MAFKERIRKIIKSNNLNTPDGYDFGHNECSHIDHNKTSPDYQNPENGEYLNRSQHWIRHRLAELGEIDNGLTPEQNKWSRNKIWERMTDDEREYIKRVADIS